MLGPCEAFHQLRFIALNTSYSLNPADNYFEDMVKAWPNLEVLHLLHDGVIKPFRAPHVTRSYGPFMSLPQIFEAIHVPACFAPPFHGTLAQDTSVRYMGVYTTPVSESCYVSFHPHAIPDNFLRQNGMWL